MAFLGRTQHLQLARHCFTDSCQKIHQLATQRHYWLASQPLAESMRANEAWPTQHIYINFKVKTIKIINLVGVICENGMHTLALKVPIYNLLATSYR